MNLYEVVFKRDEFTPKEDMSVGGENCEEVKDTISTIYSNSKIVSCKKIK